MQKTKRMYIKSKNAKLIFECNVWENDSSDEGLSVAEKNSRMYESAFNVRADEAIGIISKSFCFDQNADGLMKVVVRDVKEKRGRKKKVLEVETVAPIECPGQ
jgi:hypothetical protein